MKITILAVLLILTSLTLVAQSDTSVVHQAATVAAQSPKVGILDFFKEINALNIVLLALSLFAGSIWRQGRTKLKEVGDLFLKAYEFTDDKRLSDAERAELLNRFLVILGKAVPAPQTPVVLDDDGTDNTRDVSGKN